MIVPIGDGTKVFAKEQPGALQIIYIQGNMFDFHGIYPNSVL